MKHTLIHLTTVLVLSATPTLAWCQSLPTGAPAVDSSTAADSLVPSRRIEGLWDEQVEQVDCSTGAPLQLIGRGTNLFARGGALIATNNAPPTVMGIALGQWRYGHDGKFHARMRLNLFQPPLETFVGVRDIRRKISLSNHGNSLSGTVRTQDYFPEGSPKGDPICATETGQRIALP
jgi:hypothetical protein